MITDGTEVIAGLKNDPEVGPVLVFGPGGILVELVGSVEYGLLPMTAMAITDLTARSRAHLLLRGHRGHPPADMAALVRSLVGLAQLGWDAQDRILKIDLNPLLVRRNGDGARAVDMRILVRR